MNHRYDLAWIFCLLLQFGINSKAVTVRTTSLPKSASISSRTVGSCEEFGDIRDLKPTGCSSNTFSISGFEGSQRLIQRTAVDLEPQKRCITEIGKEYELQPALLASLASRLSNVGQALHTDGFGPRGYGIMQCNPTKHKRSGVSCQQFPPRSCEHIRMMVEYQFIPDLLEVKQSHPLWSDAQIIQGAVAAYDVGASSLSLNFKEVDAATDNQDFSNDILARAQYLLSQGWGCPDSLLDDQHSVERRSVPPDCWALAKDDTCSFYEQCVELYLPCGQDGYAVAFGKLFCGGLKSAAQSFNAMANQWQSDVRKCLKQNLYPHIRLPDVTCNKLKEIAFESHVTCYNGTGGPSLCHKDVFSANMANILNIFQTQGFNGQDKLMALQQLYETITECAGPAWEVTDSTVQSAFASIKSTVAQVSAELGQVIQAVKDINVQECIAYAEAGNCKFWDCFLSRFPMEDAVNHIKEFEMPLCKQLEKFSWMKNNFNDWLVNVKKQVMSTAKTFLQNATLDYNLFRMISDDSRVDTFLNSGYLKFGFEDENLLGLLFDNKGFPNILPNLYYTKNFADELEGVKVGSYFFRAMNHLNRQIGQTNFRCFKEGVCDSPELYKLVTNGLGQVRAISTKILKSATSLPIG